MLSNLPPGVTGNEPQIAGYPEFEAKGLECGWEYERPESGELQICAWTGTETVYVDRVGMTGLWECPECGQEHEIDLEAEYGPDPDDRDD